MEEVTVEEIIHIHERVVNKFGITKGIINKGLIDAIVKRPSTKVSDSFIPFDNPLTVAASLMEGIIRWHPFADGNKRTALLTTMYYLNLEGYGVALPLSAVRFTVKIAENTQTDEKSTRKLINDIAKWIGNHSGKSLNEVEGKFFFHLTLPYKILNFLYKMGFHKFVINKVRNWLAFDIYPEYEKEAKRIMDFINESLEESYDMYIETIERKAKLDSR